MTATAGGGSLHSRVASHFPTLSVGIVSANLSRLADELTLLEGAGVELVHIDVMDGVFCPMLTVGPPVISAMRTPLIKDVHLMIDEPLNKLDAVAAAGADIITVHVESAKHPHMVLRALQGLPHKRGPSHSIVRGLALNPGTPLCVLEPLLDEVDYVLLLAVNPGWPRQSFLPSTEQRLRAVRRMLAGIERPVLVGVDGGITSGNVARVASLGADIIVAGSAVFDGKTPAENARSLLAQMTAEVDRH